MLESSQSKLQSSVSALHSGASLLMPNVSTALGGYNNVSSGVAKLLSGATSLENSSPSLASGSSKLSSASSELSSALAVASKQLAVQPTGESVVSQISQPVQTESSQIGNVPNYGYALSPYVLSLGLYVGALVFNVIYPVRRFYGKSQKAISIWISKMSIAIPVAILQALVLDLIMVTILGLRPDQPLAFIALSILTSLSYMSIVSFLAIMFDNVGRFLAMLLLVLQLGSSAGVFPIMLSPEFFQALNPFMPMTYSIYALREAISSGLGSATISENALILIFLAIGFSALLLLSLHLKHLFTKNQAKIS